MFIAKVKHWVSDMSTRGKVSSQGIVAFCCGNLKITLTEIITYSRWSAIEHYHCVGFTNYINSTFFIIVNALCNRSVCSFEHRHLLWNHKILLLCLTTDHKHQIHPNWYLRFLPRVSIFKYYIGFFVRVMNF